MRGAATVVHSEHMERMNTPTIVCTSGLPDDDVLRPAASALREGGLVVFPTETVYGLGANALDPQAVHRIFVTKGRPPANPLILHVPSTAAARALAAHWPENAQAVADHMWPGPITLVVHRARSVPDIVTAGGPTVALRCPAHPIALRLIELAGVPVAAPSANLSGSVSPTRVEHLDPQIRSACAFVVDAGPCEYGLESTVLDITVEPPMVLRPGAVTRDEIAEIVGTLGTIETEPPPNELRSPGTHGKHYAPRARVILVEKPDPAVLVASYARADASEDGPPPDRKAAFVTHDAEAARMTEAAIATVVMPSEPRAYGRRLYAVLQELDSDRTDVIIVHLPPDTAYWEAVRDRLRRAALR